MRTMRPLRRSCWGCELGSKGTSSSGARTIVWPSSRHHRSNRSCIDGAVKLDRWGICPFGPFIIDSSPRQRYLSPSPPNPRYEIYALRTRTMSAVVGLSAYVHVTWTWHGPCHCLDGLSLHSVPAEKTSLFFGRPDDAQAFVMQRDPASVVVNGQQPRLLQSSKPDYCAQPHLLPK